ncbi:MAG TPA: FAD-linked oxidase C-terminal domain-containing protein [Chloroflexota bacterium]|nr:FAD-linked oxidase C-terminal domain-containing protein [Chloroflexota bacterium]
MAALTTKAKSTELGTRLRAALPAGAIVLVDPGELQCYAYDASFEAMVQPRLPDAAVQPRDTADVSALARFASENRIPLTARGAATGQAGGALPARGGIVADMSALNRVLEVDAANLQVVIQPGVVHADLNDRLARSKLIFPPDPGSSRMCTVGGMVSNNSRGMRAIKYGSTGDYVLGLEVVLADGRVITTGSLGSRALQSSSGFELTKLFVGSEGMLGIITRLRLKVIPKPPNRGMVMAQFARLAAAGESVGAVLSAGILPSAIEILDASAIKAVNLYRPALQLPDAEAILLYEVDGNAAAVAQDARRIAEVVRPLADQVDWSDEPKRVAALWEARSVVGAASGQIKPGCARVYAGEDICVPLQRVPETLLAIQDLARQHDLTVVTYGHIASGNIHPAPIINVADPDQVRSVRHFANEVHLLARRMNGTVTGEHGVGLTRIPYMREEHGEALDVMWQLKQALDPHNILNPGKMFPSE